MYNVEFSKKYRGYQIVGCWVNNSHRCGYVRLPKNHVGFGIDYDNKMFYDIDCHGGLTYSSKNNNKTYPIKTKEVSHWIGFDCAHLGDSVGGVLYYPGDIECLEQYVLDECKGIVDQLKEITHATKQQG